MLNLLIDACEFFSTLFTVTVGNISVPVVVFGGAQLLGAAGVVPFQRITHVGIPVLKRHPLVGFTGRV